MPHRPARSSRWPPTSPSMAPGTRRRRGQSGGRRRRRPAATSRKRRPRRYWRPTSRARRGATARKPWPGPARPVHEAKAATADEALQLGVIDAIADDVPDLLRQFDGHETEIAGVKVTLHTAGTPIQTLPMTPIDKLLHTITDPNIAFILMTLGVNGLL